MAAKRSPALDYIRQYLRDKPEASFAEIRDAARELGLTVLPILFGRAKALEGLVEVAPYGSKKKNKLRDAATQDAREPRPARPSTSDGQALEAVVSELRNQFDDRTRYREALVKISEILDRVL